MTFTYAVSHDDEAVRRLAINRGHSPEFGEESRTGRPQVIGLIHQENDRTALLFVRFTGHRNPSDNGLVAYLVEGDSSLSAAQEAGKIFLSIRDGFDYHNRLRVSPLRLTSSWYPYLTEEEWDALREKGEAAGLTPEHWYEIFLAFDQAESLSRLSEFYAPPTHHVERLVEVVSDRRVLEYFSSQPEAILCATPRQFEELVAELLDQLGYRNIQLCSGGRDGGVDITAYLEHAVGIERIVVQCKRYTPPKKVSEPVVKQLLTDTNLRHAARGLVVTTSVLTKPARLLVEGVRHRLSYIEGDELIKRLKEFRPPSA